MELKRNIPLNKKAFESIDNKCWVFELAIKEAGLSTNYYRKERSIGSERLEFISHPKNKNFSLVNFDTMSEAHQQKIIERWKSPYEYIAKEPIRQLVKMDTKAEEFFKAYQYDGNKILPIEHRNKYTTAACWLNMLLDLNEDKKYIKKELNLSLEKFWEQVCEIIATDNIDLPSSYRRVMAKLKEYKEQSYASLIDWRFGNKLSAKIGKTENGFDVEVEQKQLSVIKKLARLHMNFDAVQIADMANIIFSKNGWQQISSSTIQNKIAQYMPQLTPGRKGARKYNANVAMQVTRERPPYPSYYWTLDGWTVELLYQEGTKYDNRLVMVVVLDAMNNYPVGYAIGERENTDLIRMALRNAIIHMQDLFGATYRPWQLQSDRYGLKNLTPFYQAVSHIHTPAAVGNAKSKVVEPYFKYLNKTHCQKHFNWSGFNITAKGANQPNTEMLDKIKVSFPNKEGVLKQINKFMDAERQIKVGEYTQQWQVMPPTDQVTLTPEDCLFVFGKQHNEFNSITGHGLIATLEGQKMIFDSFDPAFRALQYATEFKIIYDENDFSQVIAITKDGKQKFLLHNKVKVGMGFKNTTPQQLDYHQKIRDFNTDRREEILQQYIIEDAIVQEVLENTPLNLNDSDEAALKLMLTFKGQQKERLQDAKGLQKIQNQTVKAEQKQEAAEASTWQQMQQQYLTTKTDFNQYLD